MAIAGIKESRRTGATSNMFTLPISVQGRAWLGTNTVCCVVLCWLFLFVNSPQLWHKKGWCGWGNALPKSNSQPHSPLKDCMLEVGLKGPPTVVSGQLKLGS